MRAIKTNILGKSAKKPNAHQENQEEPAKKKHFDSHGEYYGFGSRNDYGALKKKHIKTSVALYVTQPKTSLSNRDLATIGNREPDDVNSELEAQICASLSSACKSLTRIFSGTSGRCIIRSSIAMIEAGVIAAQDANPWLQNVLDFLGKTKFACAFYNVKAETRESHTEPDISMTLVSSPWQEHLEFGEVSPYSFNFYLSGQGDDVPIVARLNAGVNVLFHGFFLAHRQEFHGQESDDNKNIVNVSAYGTKDLFSYIRSTISKQAK